MTQLTYNEAFDPYHAVFRFIRLHAACRLEKALPFDLLRILDFYLLFPFRLQSIRLFAEDTGWRKISRSYAEHQSYEAMPDDNTIFVRMEPSQRAAAASLVHSGYLSVASWDMDEVQFVGRNLPDALLARCNELNERMAEIMDILCQIKVRYPLSGRDGLKDRTGLLEHRYDAV